MKMNITIYRAHLIQITDHIWIITSMVACFKITKIKMDSTLHFFP